MSDRTNLNQSDAGTNGTSVRSRAHYQIPKEPGRNTSLVLAGVMHVLLFLFLWVGIRWQSKTPVGVDAEIWDVSTRQAAPEPVAETPPPPPPEPEVTKPEPAKPSPREIAEEHDAEIALERAREKRIAEKKLKEEQLEQEKEHEKDQKKRDKEKLAEQKKADEKQKKQREDDLKRMLSPISGSGGTGDAVKSTGNNRVDAGYAGKIAAKIKSNMIYVGSDNPADNPTVDFRIDLFPDGSLRGPPKKTRGSGVAAFDDAIERAIIKSAPYPADSSGNVPPTITSTYRLKDLTQ